MVDIWQKLQDLEQALKHGGHPKEALELYNAKTISSVPGEIYGEVAVVIKRILKHPHLTPPALQTAQEISDHLKSIYGGPLKTFLEE